LILQPYSNMTLYVNIVFNPKLITRRVVDSKQMITVYVKYNVVNCEYQAEGSAYVGKPFDVVVKLVNPLSVALTSGHINVEGPGIQRLSAIKVKYVL